MAVQIQDSLPYLEPEYWYYPVRQSLGAALLMAGRADEAIEVFRAALLDAPNNGWALYGLMQAYDARNDQPAKAAAENCSPGPGSAPRRRISRGSERGGAPAHLAPLRAGPFCSTPCGLAQRHVGS